MAESIVFVNKILSAYKINSEKRDFRVNKSEIDHVKSQIADLTPTIINVDGCEISVNQELVLSMIDGKVCSTLSDRASQNCHICGATPSQMNDLKSIRNKIINEETLSLGISSLHAWIKCFECILHISYRLEIKNWQVRKENKAQVEDRKKRLQERFRNEMGLLVDIHKPGFDSTKDGNTARRFLDNPSLAADITGVDEELIRRFGTILKTISCGFSISVDAFEKYCSETAELYVKKYKWFYMPQSIHKILIHGPRLIKEAVLPIGILSEEAQEARNKDYKNIRNITRENFPELIR